MKKLEAYKFTLVLDCVDDQTEDLEDQLFEAGCDDSLINSRNGTIYLDFNREASSIEEAIISAIKDVESSNPKIRVISILPNDLVSEADIAKRLHMDRQRVSLWVKREREGKNQFFPIQFQNYPTNHHCGDGMMSLNGYIKID